MLIPILMLSYSLWIPLYPVGFICEGVIAYKSIVFLEETQRYMIMAYLLP